MQSEAILQLDNVHVAVQGRPILKGLHLKVHAGEVYALLGANGAGKTTTLNVLLGFARPQRGQVRVAGHCPSRQPTEVRRLLAYIPENVALFPHLSGAENLRYFCALGGMAITKDRAASVLADAGVAVADAHRRVGAYSKGMRQKVGLAIARVKQARAMLLDEPTTGLDPTAVVEFARQVQVAQAAGLAILVVTHDLACVCELASRVGILHGGTLVEELGRSDINAGALSRRWAHRIEVSA